MSPAAATYLRKAERAVAEAELLLQAQRTEGACNRAYYAMFDAAQAALLAAGEVVDGTAAKTHRGLIAAFGRVLVQTGRVDAALGRAFNRAHEVRLLADYTAEPPALAEAAWAVEQAGQFVTRVRETLFAQPDSEDGS